MEFSKADLNEANIRDLINLYSTNYKSVKVFNVGGVANNNYRLTTDTLDIVVKVYSHGQSDFEKIQQELIALNKFAKAGILVPQVISGLNGAQIQSYNGYSIVASVYIPGTRYDNLKFTKDRMLEVGRITGMVVKTSTQLDTAAFKCLNLEEEFEYVLKGIDEKINEKKYEFDLTLFNKDLPNVRDIVRKLDQYPHKFFIHKDIWPYNLIEAQNGTYLLDFNDWAIGPQIIEIAVPILEFGMFLSCKLSAGVVRHIIEGYRSVTEITFSHEELWETVLFICFLYFLYNVIQADTKFESEIYLKRIKTLIKNPDIFKELV